MIYLDRHDQWVCRYEREGVRVWARHSNDYVAESIAIAACRRLRFEGKTGDFVVNVYGQLIPRGCRSPHMLWEVMDV